jgi:hypothetical protein
VRLEAAAILSLVRLGLRTLPFPSVTSALDGYVRRTRTAAGARSFDPVARAVTAAAGRLPGQTTCLAVALTADALLRRRGLPSEIRYGVLRSPGAALRSHAWVEHSGRVIVGDLEDLDAYTVLRESAAGRRATGAA